MKNIFRMFLCCGASSRQSWNINSHYFAVRAVEKLDANIILGSKDSSPNLGILIHADSVRAVGSDLARTFTCTLYSNFYITAPRKYDVRSESPESVQREHAARASSNFHDSADILCGTQEIGNRDA